MFTIYAPDDDFFKRNHRVLDPVTGTTLELISMTQRSGGYAFLLSSENMSIPFEMSRHFEADEDGQEWLLARFQTFGRSFVVEREAGVAGASFENDEEKRRWMKIAVEAVLIFGMAYNGPASPPARYRVEFDGRVLSRADFGYGD